MGIYLGSEDVAVWVRLDQGDFALDCCDFANMYVQAGHCLTGQAIACAGGFVGDKALDIINLIQSKGKFSSF